ncbi:MAG: anhydro-N-acetylmuramic acid kinase [Betaproteobacteria bacterium]|nr:anhydro-N-acetylmuramic acid kinase [Betaproteobacteria bacterium]
MSDLHIGIMSGTSLDGADAVLVDWSSRRSIAFTTRPYSADLKSELLALSQSGQNEIERAGAVSIRLAEIYAESVRGVLDLANIRSDQVASIGCHGQTVRHRPEAGFTVQLQNPSLLAELTGITVVADFRSRDMAAGGQGAPLAPAFHDGVFRDKVARRSVVNIGGISNVTILIPGSPVSGFDCGPGNVLMDHWASIHLGKPFDEDGLWASSGTLSTDLLDLLLDEPFFTVAPPKSTGRELFNAEWLGQRLDGSTISPQDVQATLLELTARTIVSAVRAECPDCDEVIVCGGGARNQTLMRRLAALAATRVSVSDVHGIPSGQVEAVAFSWFAKNALSRQAMSLGSVTGSRHPIILGGIYPA